MVKTEYAALYIILLAIWGYILHVFKKRKLTAFYYMLGTAGLFVAIFIPFRKILTELLSDLVLYIMGVIGDVTGFFTVFSEYNLIFINHKMSCISMYIDYECCGVIEVLVLVCLVMFFPVFGWVKKIVYAFLGALYVICANIIRLVLVSVVIYQYGNDVYYLAHAVIGRLVFYVLMIILYFYMLSYSQIRKQKVGNFDYEAFDTPVQDKVIVDNEAVVESEVSAEDKDAGVK